MTSNEQGRHVDWNKIGALAQIGGVVIAAVTLLCMWWLDYRARTGDKEQPLMLVAWWMPTLIAVTLIVTAILYYKAAVESRRSLPVTQDSEQPPLLVTTTTLRVPDAPSDQSIRLTMVAKKLERASPESKWTYKSKLRIVLTSEIGEGVDVLAPDWITGKGDVPAQMPQGFCSLQLEGPRGWRADDWLPEMARLHVQHGETFRLWIGLDQSFPDDDLKRRSDRLRLGTLALPLKISGQYSEFTKRL